jgi:peroxisomal 2,4-dienoyl-CoA reductase
MSSDSPFKYNLLTSKVALITGGGSGIGLEITRQLGFHGAKVVISGRREEVLKDACATLAKEGIAAAYVQGDVRSYPDCERMASEASSRFGSLDILINCAAGNFLTVAERLTSNGFRTVMEVDTLGTFNMSRAAFPFLLEGAKKSPSSNNLTSCIVNISATLHYGATWYQTHASAAKAGVDSLTRSLALEWGSYGIRVNGVAPGPIEGTAGITKLAPGSGDALRALFHERIPLGRLGRKWDIAMAVVYLASPASSFVTGHTVVVDGGEWMWRPPVLPRDKVARASRAVEATSRKVGVAQQQQQEVEEIKGTSNESPPRAKL